MSAPTISGVIVSWNSGPSVVECLRALRRSAAAAGEAAALEVLVVDNGSTDGSGPAAAEAGADRVVRNPVNAGYVVAASQGIALARGEWVMLANPDLTVTEPFLGAMLEAARSAPPDVGCLVPDIRYSARPSIVNSRGIEVDRLGVPAEKDGGREAEPLEEPLEVFGPSTSGCLIRCTALAAIGGLEPLYFAYLEDVDLGWRMRKKGYRALVVPGALALHEGSASTGEGSWLKAFLVARNRRVLFRLHAPRGPVVRLARSATDAGHAAVQSVSGSGTASFLGRLAALRTRRYTRFLRASNRAVGIPDDAPVDLGPRQTLDAALRRKRSAAALMRSASRPPARRAGAAGGRRLRVLVDATNLKPGQGGIRTYAVGLIQALAARPEIELVVAASFPEVSTLGPMDVVDVSPRTRGVASRAAWRERNLAALAGSAGADVVLSPVPELPLRKLPVRSVVVVHDVGPLVAPAFYTAAKLLRYRAVLPRACRLASAVVCVSQATLEGLRSATRIDPAKCEVIGEGPQLLEQEGALPGVAEPYLLYVGSLDVRKNVETLAAAMLEADPPVGPELVIVGPVEGRASRALRQRLDGSDRVRHLGFVSPDELTALYRHATAVVLPSLYEGFGLPVLEAMQNGAPVVTSDIPSVREVAGEAVHYVTRPLDPEAWRRALRTVVADGALRAELSRRGREQAALHTWDEVGRRFSELLHRIAEREPAPPPGETPEPVRDAETAA